MGALWLSTTVEVRKEFRCHEMCIALADRETVNQASGGGVRAHAFRDARAHRPRGRQPRLVLSVTSSNISLGQRRRSSFYHHDEPDH